MLNLILNKFKVKESFDYDMLIRKVDGLVMFPISSDYDLGYSDALHDVKNLILSLSKKG